MSFASLSASPSACQFNSPLAIICLFQSVLAERMEAALPSSSVLRFSRLCRPGINSEIGVSFNLAISFWT